MTQCKNKTMRHAYQRYLCAQNTSLEDCYKTHSRAKENAFIYCKKLQNSLCGEDFKIISFNVMEFSAGFIGVYFGKKIFVYITKNYDRFCYIEDLES